jgi:hypothetical protein
MYDLALIDQNMRNKYKIRAAAFLFVIAYNGYGQNYPIPAENSSWGIVTCYGPPGLPGAGCYGGIEKYEINDTVMNGKTYQCWGGNMYTRYLNNKMLMIDTYNFTPDSMVEAEYYDFNLEVNDRFLLPQFFDSIYAVVYETHLFNMLNGQTRKRLKLYIDGHIGCSGLLDWIEGIGDINNTVFYTYQLGLCDIYPRIVCFSDSSGQVYKEPGFDYPCNSLENYVDLYDNIKDFKSSTDLKVLPNPFINEIIVDFPDLSAIKSIALYSTMGDLILKTDHNILNTLILEAGLYILKIDFDNQYVLCKMIKE